MIKTNEKNKEILKIEHLTMKYTSGLIRTKITYGAKDVSFHINSGEVVSLVGESGSGKSTVANVIMRFLKPSEGKIFFGGRPVEKIKIKKYYKLVQSIFQDPYSCYNSFYKVDHIFRQAFNHAMPNVSIRERRNIFAKAIDTVGLDPKETLGRYPHQLSGGQLQRLLIARALMFKPRLLIADEPTSMIDSSSRADVLNLFKQLQDDYEISILFITHDIGQAQYLSHRVIVMKEGTIIEQGPTNDVFTSPEHAYTKNLLACVPSIYRKWY
ncbi:MAG: ABC transporter ATP-binding protein [Candidatus Lokiarchaeota archaeon]|nr:ABC transporter ATP-binding protein [Candidatus Lokiarchaeota archaeon]